MKWQRIAVPFRDFSFVFSYKMNPLAPVQREEIVKVAISNSFKNHWYAGELLIDDLAFVKIEDLEGDPFPSEFPEHQFPKLREWNRRQWKQYTEHPEGTWFKPVDME